MLLSKCTTEIIIESQKNILLLLQQLLGYLLFIITIIIFPLSTYLDVCLFLFTYNPL